MTNADFEARLARIRQTTQYPAPPTPTGRPNSSPPRTYRDRLDRALAAAAAAGITEKDCFPPAMRALSAMGIPVRPLHFKSVTSLFLFGLCLGLGIFGGVLWLLSSGIVPTPERGALVTVIRFGWPGVFITSLCIGAAFAFVIRRQAARAGLPRWQDL
ncbi:hypothetical protein C0V75_13835 [Tabrizicola sp. TH137]|uniref:DUF6404 family protein n=1 Tax=Tabrizicola sp. TH137 TaxID=2067452 RepID=UPI000C7CAB12|nr:DUF6404 family protein [Tabrizicola sp. TH137]PLL11973.1 hypothetical protein C0V75_13835 [Tabrizicola sp. TH137]